jgi:hypothetical protein
VTAMPTLSETLARIASLAIAEIAACALILGL